MLSAFGGVQVKAPRVARGDAPRVPRAAQTDAQVPRGRVRRRARRHPSLAPPERADGARRRRGRLRSARQKSRAELAVRFGGDARADEKWREVPRAAAAALLLDHRARRDPKAGLPADDELKAIAECAGAQWLLN